MVYGNTEAVGNVYYRCYSYDDVAYAFKNNNTLIDFANNGGNGNTYTLSCTTNSLV